MYLLTYFFTFDYHLQADGVRQLTLWHEGGYVKSNGKPLANADLWKQIRKELHLAGQMGLHVSVEHVPRHSVPSQQRTIWSKFTASYPRTYCPTRWTSIPLFNIVTDGASAARSAPTIPLHSCPVHNDTIPIPCSTQESVPKQGVHYEDVEEVD